MDEKIAHLSFIQGVINRMGSNSFMIKGWCIALVAAIFALSADKANSSFAYLALFPLIIFWGLDSFFLRQEKMYRKLYEDVANENVKSDNFTMNASAYSKDIGCYLEVAFSKTLLPFYGAMIVMILIFMWKVLELFK
ncbi:TPA: hypothetical protein ACHUBE_005022 [Klebsiella quasipneumoniae]|jgi:hypothetical protein|uniref:hypothetical protein n=1 Tax=Enterobacteriaceae TaxID=543 RepID=UPI000F91BE6C|nr:hypothetical protein [Klebsiella pneumoniae]EAB5375469.1 hypothetical protein [Salmonella enterica subsp. enterica serovar Brunei]EFC3044439.1 hypothetical protein [Escherichia coli]EIR6863971.1 hypothetical protein [Salmonella enterica]HCJ7744487.1 hypothetical protein [Citrobacter freundii]RRE27095.1 hypothetical protein EAO00_23205 [Klebsiella pneumoniae]